MLPHRIELDIKCNVFPGGRLGGLLSEKRAGGTLAWLCPVATCHIPCIHSCKVVPCLLTDSPHSLVISHTSVASKLLALLLQ